MGVYVVRLGKQSVRGLANATACSLRSLAGAGCSSFGNRMFFLLWAALAAITPVWSQNYVIATFAGDGSGSSGYSGDLYPATIARMSNPSGVAIDGAGNVYFADYSNHRVRKVAVDGTITTVAGNGNAGYTGDGGPAIGTTLYYPNAVALDASGNLYIADTNNNRIRKVSPEGTITTVVGTGTRGFSGDNNLATGAWLNSPLAVAVDSAGNLYLADSGNGRIRKVGTNGNITTIASGLNNPEGLAVDSSGNVYIADTNDNLVQKLGLDNKLTVVAGGGPCCNLGDGSAAISATLSRPHSVAVDSSGTLYIADTNDHRVRMVSANGVITTIAGSGNSGYSGDGGKAAAAQLSYPQYLAVANNRLYVADTGNNCIRVLGATAPLTITTTQIPTATLGKGGYTAGPLATGGTPPYTWAITSGTLPPGLSLNSSTGAITGMPSTFSDTTFTLGVTDSSTPNQTAHQLFTVSSAQTYNISTLAGTGSAGFAGDNGPATAAQLNNPNGVTVDAAGNVYITDSNNHRIRKVSPNHTITTFAGNGKAGFSGDGGPAISAQLYYPSDVTVDLVGNVYIADNNNNLVRKVSPQGVITTVAGSGQPGFSGDGGPATSAQLRNPDGVGLDASGNLYIADYNNGLVRKVDPSGVISTIAGGGSCCGWGDGNLALSAGFNAPSGVHADSAGNLYVSVEGQNRIAQVLTNGFIRTLVGGNGSGYSGDGGPSYSAQLNVPADVAIDAAGALYIPDYYNNRIRKVTPDLTITTIAGSGSSGGFSGDGGPALSALLNRPSGIAVDLSGRVYIADSSNNRVRVLTPAVPVIPLTINTTSLASGLAGKSYTATLQASGGSSPYAWSISSGALPSNVVLDPATGVISGTPPTAGSFGFTIQVTDTSTPVQTARQALTLTIMSAPSGLTVNPSTLNFSAPAKSGVTPVQEFAVSSSASGLSWTASSQTQDGSSWLLLSATQGAIPGNVGVSVDASQLNPGKYSGTVSIQSPLASSTVQTVSINVTIAAPNQAHLTVTPPLLSFSTQPGGIPPSQSLLIGNSGSNSLSWTANATTQSGQSWLSLIPTPSSGTATTSSPNTVSVSANSAALSAGSYTGQVAVQSSTTGESAIVPVTFAVQSPSNSILLSRTGLVFTGVQGGAQLPAQNMGIINLGTGTLNWTTRVNLGNTWLSVTPSGSSQPGARYGTVTITVDVSSLTAGAYIGQIEVDSPGADNSPQYLAVDLTVLAPGSDPGVQVQPTGLIFVATPGGTAPPAQNVSLATSRLADQSVAPTAGTASAVQWLAASPPLTTLKGQGASSVGVTASPGSLTAGAYRGSVTLNFGSEDAQTVQALLLVTSSSNVSTQGLRGAGAASSCVAPGLVVQHQSLSTSIVPTSVWPGAITVSVKDNCGNPIDTANVTATFNNGDPPLPLSSLQTGTGLYVATWRPGSSASPVTVVVSAAQGSSTGTSAFVSVAVPDTSKKPAIAADGIVNAASFGKGVPVVPGSIVSIFGANLSASIAGTNAPGSPLPTILDQGSVQAGEFAMPLFYASSGQINAQVPFELAGRTKAVLVASKSPCPTHQCPSAADNSLEVQVSLAAASPALFSLNAAGQGTIQIANTSIFAAPVGSIPGVTSRPVAKGDYITIYATGLGDVTNRPATGVAAPASPLSSTVVTPTATIGGASAAVSFSGLVPGLVGLYQVNVQVPPGAPSGNSVPVVVSMAGIQSNTVTIAVQ
jgi:uncharacterized protein (TIGR03437 family)